MRTLRALAIVLLVTGLASAAGNPGDVVSPSRRLPRLKGCTVIVTGYNSLPNQTDDTPFITASQTPTRWGVVAARWLPFGARVQFPGHFDNQVFVVEDRTHRRHSCKMDIWFAGKTEADEWGIQNVYVKVLEPRGFTCPSQPVSVKHKCPEPS